jgi:hypothetical protein
MILNKLKNQDGLIIIVMFTGMGIYLMLFIWVLILGSETGLPMRKIIMGNNIIGLLSFSLFLLFQQVLTKSQVKKYLTHQILKPLILLQFLTLSFAFGSLISLFLSLGI